MKNQFTTATLRGFSLAEMALALGITAFCLVAVLGLLPVGLKGDQSSHAETAAIGILSMVAADLRSTPSTNSLGQTGTSGLFKIPIPASPVAAASIPATLYFDQNGSSSALMNQNSRYLLTLTFSPNAPNARAATLVNLRVSWPAATAPQNATGSVAMFLALDRN